MDAAKKDVRDRYGNKCALTISLTGESLQVSHIIPDQVQDLMNSTCFVNFHDNIGNLLPTIDAGHKAMELYQHAPLISFKYDCAVSATWDQYTVVISKSMPQDHVVRICRFAFACVSSTSRATLHGLF